MRSLVGNQRTPPQLFVQGRLFIQKHTPVIIQCRSGMLHTTKLESGYNNQIVLGKRIRNTGIIFHPSQSIQYLSGNLRALGYPLRIRLPVINRNGAFVPLINLALQFPGYKRKQISRQRFRFLKTDQPPVRTAQHILFLNLSISHSRPVLRNIQR